MQSHTYAGSSSRALANGKALLDVLPNWRSSVNEIGDAVAPICAKLNSDADGAIIAHGQGALWGGLFAHSDPAQRTAANLKFKARCIEKGLLPYFIPVGGFMLTPRYDDDVEHLRQGVEAVAAAALETAQEMNWKKEDLLARAEL